MRMTMVAALTPLSLGSFVFPLGAYLLSFAMEIVRDVR
jgi:hypothetical protein